MGTTTNNNGLFHLEWLSKVIVVVVAAVRVSFKASVA
jgi:hypothetical protein